MLPGQSKLKEVTFLEIQWNFHTQTDHLVEPKQITDKKQKKAMVTDIVIPSDRNIKEKAQHKLKEEPLKM